MQEPSPEERLPGVTDGELVRRALAGDRGAFGELVGRYERIVGVLAFQKVGNHADAEDVAQEAFLKAYAALAELEDRERFGSWLYGIAVHASIDHLRRRARRGPAVPIDAGVAEAIPARPDAEADPGTRDEAARVVEAVGELPDKYRIVLTLRYQKLMSYQEIAEHLGEPPGTISNRIHRAAGMLRERLKGIWASRTT